MKKTIAILLVLIIAGAGLFATTGDTTSTDLKLTVAIADVFHMKLVKTGSKLASLDLTSYDNLGTGDKLATKAVDKSSDLLGYLYIKTNNQDGYVLSISGAPLASTTASTTINYTISAGTASYITSTSTATNYTRGAATALVVDEYSVIVDLVESDYDNAAKADYEADVTFTYTAV